LPWGIFKNKGSKSAVITALFIFFIKNMIILERFLQWIVWNYFSGDFYSKSKGDGYDIEYFKEYQVGDNLKRINRKLTAKYDKNIVWVYKDEKTIKLQVFIDNYINLELVKDKLSFYLDNIKLFALKHWISLEIFLFNGNWNFTPYVGDFYWNKKSFVNNFFTLRWNEFKIFFSDFLFMDKCEFLKNSYFGVFDFEEILKNFSFDSKSWFWKKNCNFFSLDFCWNIFVEKIRV
jgi:hypothetical protein